MHSFFTSIFVGTLLASLSLAHASPLEFSSARIIQPPPGAKVAAAYFTVHNNSQEALLITGASSDASREVSIHLTRVIDDVAMMVHQDSVTIEANSSLEFKQGSYHLMLMGLQGPLTPESILEFDIETSGGVVPIMIPVITPDESAHMHDDSMSMDNGHAKANQDHDASMQHNNTDAAHSTDKDL